MREGERTPRPVLLLLNGAPGAGKSTLAAMVAAERPMALALDLDAIKHSLGGWDHDVTAAGSQARRLGVALIRQHLAEGHDVVLGQYLARTAFLEELEDIAAQCGATFVEAVLVLEPASLAGRLAARRASPDRPEQAENDRFVGPEDAEDLVRSIENVLQCRPAAHPVNARGSVEDTLEVLRQLLSAASAPEPRPAPADGSASRSGTPGPPRR